MSGVYLGRGSAPSDGTGIGSVITQHVGIHLLLQLIAGGKGAVRKPSQGPGDGPFADSRWAFFLDVRAPHCDVILTAPHVPCIPGKRVSLQPWSCHVWKSTSDPR